ncbi:MAG: hypothetical protein AAGG01_16275 [Planctomycetota bacterium]
MIKTITSLAVCAAGATLLFASTKTPAEVIEVGDKPAYSFKDAPTNSMGITSLEELRGKPVLVEFWGTR